MWDENNKTANQHSLTLPSPIPLTVFKSSL
jgi:hypothetical protein